MQLYPIRTHGSNSNAANLSYFILARVLGMITWHPWASKVNLAESFGKVVTLSWSPLVKKSV